MPIYYHGGIPGLKPGDRVLPPSETGVSTLLQYAQEIAPDGTQRNDRVYIATDINAAVLYAAVYPWGDIYEVTPGPELDNDPDCDLPGLSYQCSYATVKKVARRKIDPELAMRALQR